MTQLFNNRKKMAKKKNRLQEVKDREAQKKKIFETIAGTKSYHTPIEHYKNEGKGIDLELLAESGFKFAEEDKDFLNKTKAELDEENKGRKQLNEHFLGLGNFAVVGNISRTKTDSKPVNESKIGNYSVKWTAEGLKFIKEGKKTLTLSVNETKQLVKFLTNK